VAHQNAGDKKIDDDLIGGHHSFEAGDFFGDKKRGHRMGCTCATLIILLIILMLLLGVGIYLAGKSTSVDVATNSDRNDGIEQSIESQIDDSVKSRNEKVSIVVSNADLVNMLPSASMNAVITKDNIFVTSKCFGFSCVMEIEPYISEGQLRFKAKSAKMGSLPMPGFLVGSMSGGFATATNKITQELSVINLESIEKQDGKLVLIGKVIGR